MQLSIIFFYQTRILRNVLLKNLINMQTNQQCKPVKLSIDVPFQLEWENIKEVPVTATKYKWICTNCSSIIFYIWQHGCQGSIWLLTKRKEVEELCVFWNDKKCCPNIIHWPMKNCMKSYTAKRYLFLMKMKQLIKKTFTNDQCSYSLFRFVFISVIPVFIQSIWWVFTYSIPNLGTIPCSDKLFSSSTYSLSYYLSLI